MQVTIDVPDWVTSIAKGEKDELSPGATQAWCYGAVVNAVIEQSRYVVVSSTGVVLTVPLPKITAEHYIAEAQRSGSKCALDYDLRLA